MDRNKKSRFFVLAEAIASGKIAEVDFKSPRRKRLTKEQLDLIVQEELEKIREEKEKEKDKKSWEDADVENEVDWMKALDIKEVFLQESEEEEEKEDC